jgi:hypothetical protein
VYYAPPGSTTGGSSGGSSTPNCNTIVAAVGFSGLTYTNALQIWNDGSLSGYSTDGTAATIAALAAVTWQGESSFQTNPINNGNTNSQGVVTSTDYGPFQINQTFHPNPNSAVWGTNGAGQRFNGNVNANIAFGISILEGLFNSYGNNAAGRYVGSLGNLPNGMPINPSAQKRDESPDLGRSHGLSLQIDEMDRHAALLEEPFRRTGRRRILKAENLDIQHVRPVEVSSWFDRSAVRDKVPNVYTNT